MAGADDQILPSHNFSILGLLICDFNTAAELWPLDSTENRCSEQWLRTIPLGHRIREVRDPNLVLVALPAWIFKVTPVTHFRYTVKRGWQFCLRRCSLFKKKKKSFSKTLLAPFCLFQITKALSVRVLSEVHEKQKHPPEAHKEVRLVPSASQWNLQKRRPFRIWG